MITEPQRLSWLNTLPRKGRSRALSARLIEALYKLDAALFAMWDLGDSVILGWTHDDGEIRFLRSRKRSMAARVAAAPTPSSTTCCPVPSNFLPGTSTTSAESSRPNRAA
jgi:hypothetical protein